MALFNRRKKPDDDSNAEQKKEKGGWRRPANTAFKQQRLKAWQPILTPKTVIPTFFILGILFAPIAALLIWGSDQVSEMTIDYTKCDTLTPSSDASSPSFTKLSSSDYSYRLRSSASSASISPPQYAFVQNSSSADPSTRNQCIVQFDVPLKLDHNVFLYYKLTNFFQNHRRYVKSLDTDQLRGKAVSHSTISGGACKPLDVKKVNGSDKIIFPCGLIANSVFNDTFSNLTLVSSSSSGTYTFSEKGIAWPGEAKKYTSKTKYSLDQIVPPPNWALRYPDGYTDANPPPDLKNDEHFQNWMRTAGLPTFTKLYGRNDHDDLEAGTYQMTINMNFPVRPYKGTKSIVISTVSWIGGKNPFLGWAYVGASALFILLGILGTIRHVVKPRRLGDMSLLSWNR
ncbi:cell cycle control protein [Punctularia strigosozonata HHB-11173 SS5]|uniref:cell cycle control protein n=1 Tax=Punctularia strigosozonata (strain HHB-11173) TaxID=741275 RepID=UPI0004417094|nr:cell cycle control protein [Punctularia strigosozonata HHB-11173 SS5]EIN07646.1 cell cycle control protein [Punctularia strigosozonata HHB-11173 SS5]